MLMVIVIVNIKKIIINIIVNTINDTSQACNAWTLCRDRFHLCLVHPTKLVERHRRQSILQSPLTSTSCVHTS